MTSCLYYWGLAHEPTHKRDRHNHWEDYDWNGQETKLYPLLDKDISDGMGAQDLISLAVKFGSFFKTIGWKTDLTIEQLKVLCLQGFTCILNIQAWGHYTSQREDVQNYIARPNSLDDGLVNEEIDQALKVNWWQVWEHGHWVVLAAVQNDHVQVMDPRIPARYGRISIKDLEARWHDWSDDGKTKEYHGALILRGDHPIDQDMLVEVK